MKERMWQRTVYDSLSETRMPRFDKDHCITQIVLNKHAHAKISTHGTEEVCLYHSKYWYYQYQEYRYLIDDGIFFIYLICSTAFIFHK